MNTTASPTELTATPGSPPEWLEEVVEGQTAKAVDHATPCSPRCEGWRRHGGAFTLGPPQWVQCANTAVVLLTIEQDGQITRDSPACPECWQEGIKLGIKQIAAVPVANVPTHPPDGRWS